MTRDARDLTLSPHTGYTRQIWATTADSMLLAVRQHASSGRPLALLPGPNSAYGAESDSLEAFARTFLMAAFRLAGENGVDPLGFADWYAAGLAEGTDPSSPNRWLRPNELQQVKVEAASIALGLHFTRPWIWDRLDASVQENVVDWLATVIGEEYPPTNWVWFQLVVEAFLKSVGGPWSLADVEAALNTHESQYHTDGWYADGPKRSFDHYNGWALQFYPLLWSDMAGPDLCDVGMRAEFAGRLHRFLSDAVKLIDASGAPLFQGRSLTYRFAAAAPFWLGAWAGATPLSPGLTRRVCSGMLDHFVANGVLDERGLLPLGWHGEWPAMAQSYSGFGSPYWASKGTFGLLLPASHPVWTAVEEPLPVERENTTLVVKAAGWLISGTAADGIVRVVNHGTDAAVSDEPRSDSPLYARLGYSTATIPPLVGSARTDPVDNSVVLVDADGRRSHRTGFTPGPCAFDGDVATGMSRGQVRWIDASADTFPDHGSGSLGDVVRGPVMTVGSLLRGATEVRAVRFEAPADGQVLGRLELGGWPVHSHEPLDGEDLGIDGHPGVAVAGRVTSSLVALHGFDTAVVHRETGTTPVGEHVAVPVLRTAGEVSPGTVYVAAVRLSAAETEPVPTAEVEPRDGGHSVRVTWRDGASTELAL